MKNYMFENTKRLILIFIYFLFVSKILSAYPPNYEESLELFKQGKHEESLQKIREVFDNYKNSLEFRLLAASNYIELKDMQKALAHLNYAQIDHPNSWEVYILMSEIYIKNNQPNLALKVLYAGIEKFNSDKKINHLFRYQIAKSFYTSNNYAKARQQLEYIISNEPANEKALYLDALIYMIQNNYELAEFRFKSLLYTSPNDKIILAKVYNNLGVIKELSFKQQPENSITKLDLKKEAINYYNKALEIESNYILAKDNLANLTKDN